MSTFTKYHSIKNVYNSRMVCQIIDNAPPNTSYIIQEKIHGVNFSIGSVIKNGTRIIYMARRGDVLQIGEEFNHWELEYNNMKRNYIKLVDMLITKGVASLSSNIIVRGELCGCHYPNKKNTLKAIQTGVYYSPTTQYIVYDICIDDNYLNVDIAMEYAHAADFHTAPIIERHGTLDYAVQFDVHNFNSVLCKKLNADTPPNNIAEGIVIKACPMFRLPNGQCAMLKYKSHKFSERVKYASIEGLLDTILPYVNMARLNNVVSKMLNPTVKSVGFDMANDVIADYIDDYPDVDKINLNKQVFKTVYKFVNKHF